MSREAMRQALEALEAVHPYTDSLICYASTIDEHPPNAIDGKVGRAITALRQVLEQQPAEHITDGSPCWCEPETNYTAPETGASVIVHREPQ